MADSPITLNNRRIHEAVLALADAKRILADTVLQEYPLGTTIQVTLGNARITGTVIDHNFWLHDAGTIWIRNTKTGKVRRVDTTYTSHDIVIIPPQA